jgi:hypothetical protein
MLVSIRKLLSTVWRSACDREQRAAVFARDDHRAGIDRTRIG